MQTCEKCFFRYYLDKMQKQKIQTNIGIIKSSANRKIVSDLLAQDAKIIEFPTPKIKRILPENWIETIEQLSDFDWLVFTDILAVEYFLEILEEREFDLFELDNLRVCSYGEAVSDRLRFVQLHSDVIPSNLEVGNIFKEITAYIADEKDLKDSKFLIIKGGLDESEIVKLFNAQDVFVREISVYQSMKESSKELTVSKSLLLGGAVDEFIFTSPIDYLFLKQFFAIGNLQDLLAGTKIIASDETTFQFLRENGFKPKLIVQK